MAKNKFIGGSNDLVMTIIVIVEIEWPWWCSIILGHFVLSFWCVRGQISLDLMDQLWEISRGDWVFIPKEMTIFSPIFILPTLKLHPLNALQLYIDDLQIFIRKPIAIFNFSSGYIRKKRISKTRSASELVAGCSSCIWWRRKNIILQFVMFIFSQFSNQLQKKLMNFLHHLGWTSWRITPTRLDCFNKASSF